MGGDGAADGEEILAGAAASPRSLIDRALAVLATFQGGRVRQTLSEISRRSGLPMATCHRIVQGLDAWGALERDPQGRYHVGLRLWEIASLAPRSTDLLRAARPHMLDLFETTHYYVQLAVREGTQALSIERLEDPRRGRIRPRIGGRYDLNATAVGQVLLAHAPDDVREQVLSSPLTRHTERTPVTRDALQAVIDRVRHRGYAVSDREVDDAHLGVAAPVRSPDGEVIAALSLTMEPDGDVTTAAHLARMAARAIGRDLREPD